MIDFHFYLITDRHNTGGRPLTEALKAAAQAGIKAIQLREKDMSPRELCDLAIELRGILHPLGTRLLINDRADIACAAELDGVHLTSFSLAPDDARCCLRDGSIIGVSTHSLTQAEAAEKSGADFITFGPVFYTPSKAIYGEPRGVEELRQVCSAVKIPVFALGGITPDRVNACLDAGAHGVAAISAILAAKDIAQTVQEFKDVLGEL